MIDFSKAQLMHFAIHFVGNKSLGEELTLSNKAIKFKDDFKVGYSPERINPGDTKHTLTNVVKVVSGCCEEKVYFAIKPKH